MEASGVFRSVAAPRGTVNTYELPIATPARKTRTPFDDLLEGWFPITYLLNNLNRGLGLPDAYPFVLSPTVVENLRFVHEPIAAQTSPRLRRRTPQ